MAAPATILRKQKVLERINRENDCAVVTSQKTYVMFNDMGENPKIPHPKYLLFPCSPFQRRESKESFLLKKNPHSGQLSRETECVVEM